MIPYGRQDITQSDIDAVAAVLTSDFLTQGPAVSRFEQAVSELVGSKYAVATNSATAALHIACLALGLGKNDWLWTSPITFVASANCALYCGAKVDFVDIDPKTYNLSVGRLAEKLEQAEQEGKLPKVVVPVHLCGQSCDMKAIFALSKRYGFKIIEDASHAIGGKYNNSYIGGCQYGDVTIFSFHPVKIITTGEGGMALTNNAEIANKMELLRSHGIIREKSQMTKEPDGLWYYQQIELGFNYRMTDIQAALGISQLTRLDSYVKKRNELADKYYQLLDNLPLTLPKRDENCYSAFHLFVIRIQLNKIKSTHVKVFEKLRNKGIGVNLHYIPLYKQPYYIEHDIGQGVFQESDCFYSEAISLPLYPTMSAGDQHKVVDALSAVLV